MRTKERFRVHSVTEEVLRKDYQGADPVTGGDPGMLRDTVDLTNDPTLKGVPYRPRPRAVTFPPRVTH